MEIIEQATDETEKTNHSHESVSSSPSKCKTIVSQFWAASGSSLLSLSLGMSTNFSTLLIPELSKPDSEIIASRDDISWIGSLNYFCEPLGGLLSALICKRFGRRNNLTLATLPYLASWLLIYYSGASVLPIYLSFAIFGATNGLIEAPVQIYASEISRPESRGLIASFLTSAIAFGMLLQIVAGGFVDWRTLALVNMAFPAMAFLAMVFVPESPHWLAKRGRSEEAKSALRRLRGWTTSDSVQLEYDSIVQTAKSTKITSSSIPLKSKFKRYFRRSVLQPFLLVSFTFCVTSFNGSIAILTYAIPMFEQLQSPIDEYTATIILIAIKFFSCVLYTVSVSRFGKRTLAFVSLFVTGLALLVVAAFTWLQNRGTIGMNTEYNWIPLLSVLISIAATIGIRNTPWILVGEVFPSDVRELSAGLVCATYYVYAALASKSYLYMTEAFTLPGAFLFFACVNFGGLAVLYYAMPETEGKTLVEIERCFEERKV